MWNERARFIEWCLEAIRRALGGARRFTHSSGWRDCRTRRSEWRRQDDVAADRRAAAWLSHAWLEARSAGAAAIVSSHRIHDLAAVCDRCVFMGGGHIVTEVYLDGRAGDRSLVLLDAFERVKGART